MNRLTILGERGVLAPIDVQLGRLLARRASGMAAADAELVGVGAALASAARTNGHSSVLLGEPLLPAGGDAGGGDAMPDAALLRGALSRAPLCGDGSTLTPLVLERDRLYLYRYHAAERRLAAHLRRRLSAPPAAPPPAATLALFREIFRCDRAAGIDWQAVAAAAAMRGRFTIVTGGPGTGKTTTVARLLAVLLHAEPELRVALAAPTGKAAARLSEAIQTSAATLPIDAALRGRIPRGGTTIHRLLTFQPWSESFRHTAENPLGHDVVVVDEASMVDLLLMDALVDAVRPSARLILLGDQDQLASVEAGYVLGDVCRAADVDGDAYGESFAAYVRALAGMEIPSRPARQAPLRDAVVRLRRSYRFEAQPGIGAVADAVRRGDGDAAMLALDDDARPQARRLAGGAAGAALLAPVTEHIRRYLASDSPATALTRLGAFRVIAALRAGRRGAEGLNASVEGWIEDEGHAVRDRWYHLRPVLVTANDPATALYNGDVGVCFRTEGVPRVWFAGSDGSVRSVAPARLPSHETAWAMTVHKAQGSEFDHVLCVLPDVDARVLTRELLYTAVTRARLQVHVAGSEAIIRSTVARGTERATTVGVRIAGEPPSADDLTLRTRRIPAPR